MTRALGAFWVGTFALAGLFVLGSFPREVEAALSGALHALDVRSLAWALIAYLASHLLRLVRLGILLGGVRLRVLFALYWITSAASFAIPFKLGEVYRIVEISWASGRIARGVIVVWVERMFDATLLLVLVLAFVGERAAPVPGFVAVVVLVAVLAAVSLLFLKILPENMDRINLHLIRSYKGRGAISRLRWLANLRAVTDEARALLSDRFASLFVLTACVWGVELLAVLAVIDPGQPLAGAVMGLFGKLGVAFSAAPGLPAAGHALLALVLAQTLLVQSMALVCLAPYLAWKLKGVPKGGQRWTD